MVRFMGGLVIGFITGSMYSTKKLGHEYNELLDATIEDAKKIKNTASEKVDCIKSKLKKYKDKDQVNDSGDNLDDLATEDNSSVVTPVE